MRIARTVTITKISEDKQDKNGRLFRNITVETSDVVKVYNEDIQKEVTTVGNKKTASFTTYEKSYLNDGPDKFWGLEEGTILLGDIVTMAVEAYSIEERMVNKYTTVVLADSSDASTWLMQIFSTFRSNKHRCLGDVTPENVDPNTGEIINPTKELDLDTIQAETEETVATTEGEDKSKDGKKAGKTF